MHSGSILSALKNNVRTSSFGALTLLAALYLMATGQLAGEAALPIITMGLGGLVAKDGS